MADLKFPSSKQQRRVLARPVFGCLLVLLILASWGLQSCFSISLATAAESSTEEPKICPRSIKDMSIPELKEYANDKYWSGDYLLAQSAIENLLLRTNSSLKKLDHKSLEFFMNLAVCYLKQHEPDRAKKILKLLLEFARHETIDTNSGMDQPDCLFFLGECDYKIGDYKHAESLYREALSKYRDLLPPLSDDLFPCLDGLAGCLCRSDNFIAAVPIFTELVKIDALNRGVNHLTTAWSLLNLATVLNLVNKHEEASQLFEKAVYIFRQSNADRILASYLPTAPSDEAVSYIEDKVYSYVFGNGRVESRSSGGPAFAEIIKDIDFSKKPRQRKFDFDNWRLNRSRINEAPGLVTVNPNFQLKGIIICVHGLGLHHGTYEAFAKQMSDRGFVVVAFDVRGFGSYRNNKGYDKVDLNNAVNDIGGILKLMRKDYPDKPIFLLGESMGGAIALQTASSYSKEIDGLVCSVPSGSRFGATSTNFKVAFHLLKNRNRPIDIGDSIIKQATKAESLRKQWQNDPEARLQLSPEELVRFQRFMNQNLKSAERLKNLPVIIYQGYGDKLVKPEGTLELYNALTTEDKDLVFVGHSEHLIFEEGQFKPSVVNGLTGWLNSHLRDGQK